jgi:hypothetical protein
MTAAILDYVHSWEAFHCKIYFYMKLNTFFQVNEKGNTILGT